MVLASGAALGNSNLNSGNSSGAALTILASAGAVLPATPIIVDPPPLVNIDDIRVQQYDDGGVAWFQHNGSVWQHIFSEPAASGNMKLVDSIADRTVKFPSPRTGDEAWHSSTTSNGLVYKHDGTSWLPENYHVREPVTDLDLMTELVPNQTASLLEQDGFHHYVWREVSTSPSVFAWDRFSSAAQAGIGSPLKVASGVTDGSDTHTFDPAIVVSNLDVVILQIEGAGELLVNIDFTVTSGGVVDWSGGDYTGAIPTDVNLKLFYT